MSAKSSILVIAGSERAGSINLRLARHAARRLEADSHTANVFSLRDLALPIYDGDIQAATGVPASVQRLRQAIVDSDGMLLVTPEYNGFPTPLLINAFDWLSRLAADGGQPSGLEATTSKPVAVMSASQGPAGGLRALNHLRQFMQMQLAAIVVPQQFGLGGANDAFDAQGALKDERAAQMVGGVLAALVRLAGALREASAH
ncbi:MAG: NAD(P)H-dependent oxidoreductase [Burkholderiaceae bacterium]